MNIAEVIFNTAKSHAASKGETVELMLDAEAYTGPDTDRILYGTRENEGIPLTIAKSTIPGKMVVFTTPNAVEDARRIIKGIEAA